MIKSNFLKYAEFYDRLYENKDYSAEAKFIDRVLRSYQPKAKQLLSLGCGTCNHELLLAQKKYLLTAVDQSQRMLEIARKKIRKAGLTNKISLMRQDVSQPKDLPIHDSVISLFNVVGYQTSNEAIQGMLHGISEFLKPGGFFMFDCWYGPAVLKTPPTDKIKEIQERRNRIIRLTRSQLLANLNIIEINFTVLELRAEKLIGETHESHLMRYWTLPELEFLLNDAGLNLVHSSLYLDLDKSVSEDEWNMFIVAQKRS